MEVDRLTAAEIGRFEGRVRHVLDADESSVHLGSWDGERLVGVVSALREAPPGRGTGASAWRQVWGPFGEGREELMAALGDAVAGTLWSDRPTPTLAYNGTWYQRGALQYTADDIEVLEGIEAIRRRPGMYVGSTGVGGQREVVLEAISNVVDEHLAGGALELMVDHEAGVWTVADDGRGLPVDGDPEQAFAALFETMYAAPTRHAQAHHVHIGLHGVGFACLRALTRALEVRTVRRGTSYHMSYDQTPASRQGMERRLRQRPASVGERGTELRFRLDHTLFEGRLEPDHLVETLSCVAFLDPKLRVRLLDRDLSEPRGILGRVEQLADAGPGRVLRARVDEISVQVAIAPGAARREVFANQYRMTSGSIHDAVDRWQRRREDHAVVAAVLFTQAHYAGQTRDRLLSREAGDAVTRVLAAIDEVPEALWPLLNSRPDSLAVLRDWAQGDGRWNLDALLATTPRHHAS